MAMVLKFGTYTHDTGEIDLSTSKSTLFTSAQLPYATLERWTIQGRLLADTPAEMDTKLASLEAAYSGEFSASDLYLTLTDGSTASQLLLDASAATGGIRIVQQPSIPTLDRAGYVTNLAYTVVLEAEFPLADVETAIRSWTETLTFSGGGPRYGYLLPKVGLPVKQLLKRSTTYLAMQRGSAVGLYRRPSPPRPRFPFAQLEAGQRSLRSPRRYGNDYVDYGVDWEYKFESAFPLIGTPNVWGSF